MSRLRLQLIAAAIFALAWMQSSALEPKQESGILQIDPPTPYIHYHPSIPERGQVLMIHGLDASKESMKVVSAALADGGFNVYAIDLPGHGDSPAGFNSTLAQQAIQNALSAIGSVEQTIVVAHSLGATLVLDLAAQQHFSTLVLMSPAPTPLTEIQADRILLVSGTVDIPRIKTFVNVLSDVGSPHIESWVVAGAHSSAIFNPRYIGRIVKWLGGDEEKVKSAARLGWVGLMLVSAIGLGVSLAAGRPLQRTVSLDNTLGRYLLACGVPLLILVFINPLSWLRLFSTDYLVGFVCLSGITLWILGRQPIRFHAAPTLKAVGAAVFVIAILGSVVGSHFLHAALWNGRWWRFAAIAAAGLPQMAIEELTIRQIQPRWKALAYTVMTRAMIWSFLVIGVLLLNRKSAFLVMIAHLIVLFWIALWFATEIVHRHTQDPLAAAVFSTIVQGWAFAAWFVIV